MYPELYDQGAALFQRISKLEAFRSTHGLVPIGEPDRLITDLNQLSGSIPFTEEPNTTGQVHLNELHRRVIGESLFLERVYGDDTNWELAEVLKIYSMDPVDLFDLEPWLAENKGNTLNTLDKLYANGDDVMRIPLSTDIRAVRRKAEKNPKGMQDSMFQFLENFLKSYKVSISQVLKAILQVPTDLISMK